MPDSLSIPSTPTVPIPFGDVPNVLGTWHSKSAGDVTPTGAIYGIGEKVGGSQDMVAPGYEDLGFNASLSSSIYKSVSKIQIRSYQTLMIIKS